MWFPSRISRAWPESMPLRRTVRSFHVSGFIPDSLQDAGIEPNLILWHCCGSERLLVSLFGPPAAGDFLLISCVFIKSRSHRGTTTTQHSMTHKHTAWSRRLRVKPVHADLAAIHSTYFTCWPRRLLATQPNIAHALLLTSQPYTARHALLFDLAARHSTPRLTF